MIDDREFDENPEWTAEDFARARPAGEVLPKVIVDQLVRSPRGVAGGVLRQRPFARVGIGKIRA